MKKIKKTHSKILYICGTIILILIQVFACKYLIKETITNKEEVESNETSEVNQEGKILIFKE